MHVALDRLHGGREPHRAFVRGRRQSEIASGRYLRTNAFTPSRTTPPVYSPAIGSMPLPSMRGLDVGAAQDRVDRLLDEFRLAFLDDQDRALAFARSG